MPKFNYDEQTVSDLYKEGHGFRPKGQWWSDWKAYTQEQKQAEWDRLLKVMEATQAEEAEREAHHAKSFEKRVAELLNIGAGNRATALRWLIQSDSDSIDLMYGASYVCYSFGLPSEYQKELQPIINQMQKGA